MLGGGIRKYSSNLYASPTPSRFQVALESQKMYLLYFDEVKHQKNVQPYHWLGGIVVQASLVPELEAQVNALSFECFGSSRLEKSTEFHSNEIFQGQNHFKKGWTAEQRVELLKKLTKIIDRHDDVFKIQIRIDQPRLVAKDAEHKAFMFLVEKFQVQLKALDGIGMLIGDHEKSIVNESIFNLSRYREDGTDYEYGRKIDRLVDTVHFTHSHHSRMLQLADVYMYAQQMCALSLPANWPRKKYIEFLQTETQILCPHRYKHWPTENSRLQA